MLSLRKILLCLSMATALFSVEAAPRLCDSITIFGRVLCEGKPLADVAVSDGVHIVKTDSLGRYFIASNKFQNTVFVITPSGYEPKCQKRILPCFWSLLQKKRVVAEEHNFHLVKRDQSRHRVVFLSNLYLQNSHDDLLQFKRNVIPAVRDVIEDADGAPVYSIALGDTSNCSTWYSKEFDVGDAVSMIATLRYPSMLYTVMGDQDNDGAIPGMGLTDYYAERQYVYSCGPKYYSMNIGEVHYIVLDNTVFRNQPGKGKYPTEIVGKRDYDRFVTSDQLDWLRKDLSLIEDKNRPIVVCMHNTTFAATSKNRISKRLSKPEHVDSLTNCFKEFGNVHFMTAGVMNRRISRVKELPNITEHSVVSTSGNKWITSFNGFQSLASWGGGAGFEVFDINGRKLSWKQHSIDSGDKPFRLYDMNGVGDYYRENTDVQNLLREHPNSFINYGTSEFDNQLYINWWGYEPNAKIEVFEDNRPLRVRQIRQTDPLYVVSWAVTQMKQNRNKSRFSRNTSQHMFRAQRTSPTSTIRVRTTTPFGVVHEETFVGKKIFSPKQN